MPFTRNPSLQNEMLPVDVVLGPAWWHRHEGISFDEDYFFHPARRVEVERQMEQVLFDRWGRFGLGTNRDKDLPVVGAVHLAAGFLVSEMLGCDVDYLQDAAPVVRPADRDNFELSLDDAFASNAFGRLERLIDSLKASHGAVVGDVNWGGVLNVALDVRGQRLLIDMLDAPESVARFAADIAAVIERFARGLARETGTTSISVNRNLQQIRDPVFLHSECSHTMISVSDYEKLLMPLDARWSERFRPFGIHYCGEDPHRYAETFSRLPHLDFLDVGWGGDVAQLRRHLPETFLNIRYSPVRIVDESPDAIRGTISDLVRQSGNPYLTGICCVNMDDRVSDEQVGAIFEAAAELRREYAG